MLLNFYKSVNTGVFLTLHYKYCQIQYAPACFNFIIQSTSAFEHVYNEFDNTLGYTSVEK